MDFPIHDFANYYFSGAFLKEGAFNISMYFPEVFNLTIRDYTNQNFFVSYAPNTPFLPIVFIPFTWMTIEEAKWVFNLLSAILFLVSMRRFTSHFEVSNLYIWIFPLFFLMPIYNTMLFGQMYFLMLFLLSEGLIAYDQDKLSLMSGYWGLAIMLKVFPIVIIAFLLVQKSYRAVAYLGLSVLALFLISVGISGIDIWVFYWSEVLPRFSSGEIAGAYVDNYQSILMFLKRLLVFDSTYNVNPIWGSKVVFKMGLLGLKLFLFLITVLMTSRIPGLIFRFSIWMLFSIIVSAYGSTYGLLILTFLFFALGQLDLDYRSKLGIGLLLFIVLNSSVIHIVNFPWSFMRMYGWMGILGILIWNYRNDLSLRWILGIVGVLVGITTLNYEKKEFASTQFFTPLLTYDYELKKEGINYTYWDVEGIKEGHLNMQVEDWSNENTEIKENQVYYNGRQLTFDSGNKKKAIKVDDNIVFLSDYGRGLGFYGLFKIRLNEGQ
jgi:hypothetical protein